MNLKKILMLLVALVMLAALTACELPIELPFLDNGNSDSTNDGTENENNDDTNDDADENLEGLVLISKGKANFRVVYRSAEGATVVKAADKFVEKLRSLGVEIEDPISDKNASDVTDCEIIIGSNIRHRGEECAVNDKDLGKDGYTIKVVGQRVVLAGGTPEMSKKALELFTKNYLGISDKTKDEITSIAVPEDINYSVYTAYLIKSVSIGNNDLEGYKIVTDLPKDSLYGTDYIINFRDALYDNTGYWLEIVDASEVPASDKAIVVRYTKDIQNDTAGDGFVAQIIDGNFVIECAYENALQKHFTALVDDLILSKMGDVKISASYFKSERACEARYEDFGAKGDGETDDFMALLATHKYANECGQTVVGTEGAVYYVGDSFNQSIDVKTDVDLRGATILINDVGDIAFTNRGHNIFRLYRDNSVSQYISGTALDFMFPDGNRTISKDATELPWLVPYLKGESYIFVRNDNHKDFVRYGANQDAGTSRCDMFLVDANGKIDPSTAPAFEFDDITLVQIFDTNEEEIRISNGSIKNICCRTVAETGFKNEYKSFGRGIYVKRSNVVIENMTFRTVDEPMHNLTSGMDALTATYGERKESYPYGGFIIGDMAYNLYVANCTMSARTVYYEDKPATESTGNVTPAPVAMGSYGYTYSYSNRVTHYNVDQDVETGTGDSRYWGIMNSNTCKNFRFEECDVNRFDAHRGFWNAELINSSFGHSINVTGGGYLYMEGVSKITGGFNGGNQFISLRGDYGSSFDGDMYFKDCTYYGYHAYNSMRGTFFGDVVNQGTAYIIDSGFQSTDHYLNWDFGYECSLPHNITFDNFICLPPNAYVLDSLPDRCFENDQKFSYKITESITFKNMINDTLIPVTALEDSLLSKVTLIIEP